MTEEEKIRINERREKVKSYSLIKLAEELGFTVVPIGKYFTLVEHDSVRINPYKNTFKRYSNSVGGDSVAFLMEFATERSNRFKSVNYCIYWLEKKLNIENTVEVKNTPKKEKVPFVLPDADENNRRIYAYLTKTRKIYPEIVQLFLDRNIVYQEKQHKNCVFVGYDENKKPVYATERGSLPNRRFMHEIEGSSDEYGVLFENEGAKVLVITESVPDMMAFMCINYKNHLHEKYNFLSINSIYKKNSIFCYLKKHPEIEDVIIGLDNDKFGREEKDKIVERLKKEFKKISTLVVYPTQKDWNDDLIQKVKENQELNKQDELLNKFAK